MNPTPVEWRVEPCAESHGRSICLVAGDAVICRTPAVEEYGHPEQAQDETNMAFIALACNHHRDLTDELRTAILSIELANREGNPTLSAWLPDAKALLAKCTPAAPATSL